MAIYKFYRKTIYKAFTLCIVYLGAIHLLAFSGVAGERPDAKIVIEAYSGKVLYTQSADEYRYPASLTKMMTLYLVFDELKAGRLKLSSRFKVSANAAKAEPSRLGLKAGDTITVKDAIFALITKSANDVAITVAENISGRESKFAYKMTQKARDLGMSRTTFKNASGLPHPEQRTTARDMATLGRMLQIHHGNYYPFFNTKSYNIKGNSYINHNKLLGKYDGLDGIKTGYIKASGFNLVASAQRSDMRLIGVVIGGETATSRNDMMVDLLDNGFLRLASARKNWVVPQKRPKLSVASQTNNPQEASLDQLLDKALLVDLPPERPNFERPNFESNNTITTASLTALPKGSAPTINDKDVITALIEDNLAASPQGQYTIELPAESSRNAAEEKSQAALNAIQNLAPNGTAHIFPTTDATGTPAYKPVIQGLKAVDALTACQIIENQGNSCKIIT